MHFPIDVDPVFGNSETVEMSRTGYEWTEIVIIGHNEEFLRVSWWAVGVPLLA
jgi:hypothetical protein